MTDEPPGAIARSFAQGEATATRAIRRRVRRIVSHRGLGMSREDRRDVEQTVMMQLWQASQRPGFVASEIWGLVEAVTARRCIDWLRTRRTEVAIEAIPETPRRGGDALSRLVGRERGLLARAVLTRLSPACQELVRLHFEEGRSYAEISERLGRSPGALRVQLHRCLRRAARLLPDR